MPIFGINPHLESCTTFTLPLESKSSILQIFEKLRTGDYTLLMRSRIRTTMTGEGLYQRPFHIHEKSRTQGERRIEWADLVLLSLVDKRILRNAPVNRVYILLIIENNGLLKKYPYCSIIYLACFSRRDCTLRFTCKIFKYSFIKPNSENYSSRKYSLRLSRESVLELVME